MEPMHQVLAARRAAGAALTDPNYLALLAVVYGRRGQTKEGLTLLAQALAAVDKGGERAYEAELYRLKAEFLSIQAVGKAGSQTVSAGTWTLAEADHPMLTETETCFRQAIADSISVSVHHYMLKDTTVASGKWEGMRKDAHCDWMSGDHGYIPQGAAGGPHRSQG